MKRLAFAAMALALGFSAARAQNAPPAPQGEPGQEGGREVFQQCRAQAEAQGLKGPDRHAAVQKCVAEKRPDLAAAMACRQQGREKGLEGPALHEFVKSCKTAVH